jgi:hypothetical protein
MTETGIFIGMTDDKRAEYSAIAHSQGFELDFFILHLLDAEKRRMQAPPLAQIIHHTLRLLDGQNIKI